MRNMEISDANIILRYLLKDEEQLFVKAKKIVENNEIHLPFEVCAEVVYVLEKVYKIPRKNINDSFILLLNYPNISTPDNLLLTESLKVFENENIDFVDSILVSYNHIMKAKIHSFDKRVMKLCR